MRPQRLIALVFAGGLLAAVFLGPTRPLAKSTQATPSAACAGLDQYAVQVLTAIQTYQKANLKVLGSQHRDPKTITQSEWAELADNVAALNVTLSSIDPPGIAMGWHAALTKRFGYVEQNARTAIRYGTASLALFGRLEVGQVQIGEAEAVRISAECSGFREFAWMLAGELGDAVDGTPVASPVVGSAVPRD